MESETTEATTITPSTSVRMLSKPSGEGFTHTCATSTGPAPKQDQKTKPHAGSVQAICEMATNVLQRQIMGQED